MPTPLDRARRSFLIVGCACLAVTLMAVNAYVLSRERSLDKEIVLAREQFRTAEKNLAAAELNNSERHGQSLIDREETKRIVRANAALIAGLRAEIENLKSEIAILKTPGGRADASRPDR